MVFCGCASDSLFHATWPLPHERIHGIFAQRFLLPWSEIDFCGSRGGGDGSRLGDGERPLTQAAIVASLMAFMASLDGFFKMEVFALLCTVALVGDTGDLRLRERPLAALGARARPFARFATFFWRRFALRFTALPRFPPFRPLFAVFLAALTLFTARRFAPLRALGEAFAFFDLLLLPPSSSMSRLLALRSGTETWSLRQGAGQLNAFMADLSGIFLKPDVSEVFVCSASQLLRFFATFFDAALAFDFCEHLLPRGRNSCGCSPHSARMQRRDPRVWLRNCTSFGELFLGRFFGVGSPPLLQVTPFKHARPPAALPSYSSSSLGSGIRSSALITSSTFGMVSVAVTAKHSRLLIELTGFFPLPPPLPPCLLLPPFALLPPFPQHDNPQLLRPHFLQQPRISHAIFSRVFLSFAIFSSASAAVEA